MKLFFTIIALSFVFFVSGCSTIQVSYDYDAGYDFSNLSRYSWLEMPIDYSVDTFSFQRVKTAVDQRMKEKGLVLTTGSADFIVSLEGHKDTIRRTPQSTTTSQVSGHYTASEQFQEGMFTLTMIDATSNRLIWEGHGKGFAAPHLSAEDRIKKINDAVAKLLANFPPTKK